MSKMLAASSSLPNLTIIGAQSRPYGAKEPKKANKSNFNTGLSAGNNRVWTSTVQANQHDNSEKLAQAADEFPKPLGLGQH